MKPPSTRRQRIRTVAGYKLMHCIGNVWVSWKAGGYGRAGEFYAFRMHKDGKWHYRKNRQAKFKTFPTLTAAVKATMGVKEKGS